MSASARTIFGTGTMNRFLASSSGTLKDPYTATLLIISLVIAGGAGVGVYQAGHSFGLAFLAFLGGFLFLFIFTVFLCGVIATLVDIKNALNFIAGNLGGDFKSLERAEKSRAGLGYTGDSEGGAGSPGAGSPGAEGAALNRGTPASPP